MTIVHKVYVVVDRCFGERLTTIPAGKPVWVVDTPSNKTVIRRLWNTTLPPDHLKGITSFSDIESSSPEELFLMELDTIDLHHGSYSADPPYSAIEVLGAELTDPIREALKEYGFKKIAATGGGFIAERDLSEAIES